MSTILLETCREIWKNIIKKGALIWNMKSNINSQLYTRYCRYWGKRRYWSSHNKSQCFWTQPEHPVAKLFQNIRPKVPFLINYSQYSKCQALSINWIQRCRVTNRKNGKAIGWKGETCKKTWCGHIIKKIKENQNKTNKSTCVNNSN